MQVSLAIYKQLIFHHLLKNALLENPRGVNALYIYVSGKYQEKENGLI